MFSETDKSTLGSEHATRNDSIEEFDLADFEGEPGFHVLKPEWERLWWLSEDATETQTWQWKYQYWKHLALKTNPVFIVARDSQGDIAALAAFVTCRDTSSWMSKAAFLGDKRPDYH